MKSRAHISLGKFLGKNQGTTGADLGIHAKQQQVLTGQRTHVRKLVHKTSNDQREDKEAGIGQDDDNIGVKKKKNNRGRKKRLNHHKRKQ